MLRINIYFNIFTKNRILASEVVISVSNLTKFYGSVRGIEDISFEVHKGEIFGFLGPNGAGKTTSIRILLDLLRPSSGEVEIFGKPVNKHSHEIRKHTGYLPGEFSAWEHLSGIEFFSMISGIRKIPVDLDSDLFRRLDLSEKDLNKKVKALSHGTLQKLGIIQALIHEPQLLILDEPTTGLDPLMKEVFYEILLERQDKGTTIFFSSHNLDEVEKLCSRVAIIRHGKIAGIDRLDEMRKKAGQVIEVTLKNDAELHLPGAELISRHKRYYKFLVKSDINHVLKKLADLQVEQISISKPELEEVFIRYYRQKNTAGDVVL